MGAANDDVSMQVAGKRRLSTDNRSPVLRRRIRWQLDELIVMRTWRLAKTKGEERGRKKTGHRFYFLSEFASVRGIEASLCSSQLHLSVGWEGRGG